MVLVYVPGKINIADQCTRPLTITRFVKESSYLNGLDMSRLSLQDHIANSNNLILSDTSLNFELETECRVNHTSTTPITEWKRFSPWIKLLRQLLLMTLTSGHNKSYYQSNMLEVSR